VVVYGPATADNPGVSFTPAGLPDWVLLAGDESALPAMEGILAWLPATTPVRAFVQTEQAVDIRPLGRTPGAEVTWLLRGQGAGLLAAVRAAHLPAGRPYAWVAGEAGVATRLRRHLLADCGLRRDAVSCTGYWRRGAAEDELIAEATGRG
jgi:NADPH-dependent ferric siderophore reductase